MKMLYTKDGYPEINELVLCIVKKIYGNTTFVDIPEYDKEGVLTISEIAPGRIRNLRDHVMENKEIVCKVLRVDAKTGRIDVSLRRVSITVMKQKLEQIKKEEYADRIYEDIAKELKITKDELFEKTYEPIFEDYETVFEALYDIMIDNSKVDMFTNLNTEEKQLLIQAINDKIKPEEVEIKKKLKLKSYDENGVILVKETIAAALLPLNYDKISITYHAAGEFGITIKHEDMKSADKIYLNFKSNIEVEAKKNNLILEL